METIIDRIKKFNAPLIPDMVELKYKAMKQNAFRFFRGTCHLFYEDLQQVKKLPSFSAGLDLRGSASRKFRKL